MKDFAIVINNVDYYQEEKIMTAIYKGLVLYSKKSSKPITGSTVAIKVNIPAPLPPNSGACTNPVILKILLKELLKLGAKPIVYEDCYDESAFAVSGILDVCEQLAVGYVNLKNRLYIKIPVGDTTYSFSEDIYTADHLISLPKMKTHLLTNYTGAIKNMYGCLVKQQRKEFHKNEKLTDFCEVLVDVFSIRMPDITIMDGILGMEGGGPTHGKAINSRAMVVSSDAVWVDYISSSMMGYIPEKIATTKIALERKLNLRPFSDLELIGDNFRECHLNYKVLPILEDKLRMRFIRMSRGNLYVNRKLCIGCNICHSSCPFLALSIADGFPEIDPKKCKLCYCCLELCPKGAIGFNTL